MGFNSGSILNYTSIQNNISYFYSNLNPPMTLWDQNIWNFNNNSLPFLNSSSFKNSFATLDLNSNFTVPILKNSSVFVTWSGNSKGCIATGDWSGNKLSSGNQTFNNIVSDLNLTLTCEGDFTNITKNIQIKLITPTFAGGNGSSLDPFQISTCLQLQNMNLNLSGNYILISNISCIDTINWDGGRGFMPIGNFTSRFNGSLYGQGFTINDLYYSNFIFPLTNLFDYVGLFGFVENANLSYIKFNNVSFYSSLNFIGSLAGYSLNSNVDNIYVENSFFDTNDNSGFIIEKQKGSNLKNSFSLNNTISGGLNVGGLVGTSCQSSLINNVSSINFNSSSSSKIGGIVGNNCFSSVVNNSNSIKQSFSGSDFVGGIVGYNYYNSIVDNSYSNLEIISGAGNNGGIVGYNKRNSLVDNSYSSGSIAGGDNLGGIVGYNYYNSIVDNSYSNVSVSGANNIGGLVGISRGRSIINKTYSNGIVSGSGYNTGGLVGSNSYYSIIDNSYSTSTVLGFLSVGGLVGSNLYNSIIDNSYSFNNVTGTTNVGGLVGKTQGSGYVGYYVNIDNSYSLSNVTGSTNVGGLVGYNYYYAAIDNSYFNNHGGNPGVAIGLDDGLGIVNIFAIADNIPYFYLSSNSPMNLWSPSIWNFTGSNLPKLK